MPTTRPSYAITETPEVTHALEIARRKWPEDRDRPSRLILRLLEQGAQTVEPQVDKELEARLEFIDQLAGKYADLFPEGYLQELREDWPE